jgi:hypothetical protein
VKRARRGHPAESLVYKAGEHTRTAHQPLTAQRRLRLRSAAVRLGSAHHGARPRVLPSGTAEDCRPVAPRAMWLAAGGRGDAERVLAAGLSLGLAGGSLEVFRVQHYGQPLPLGLDERQVGLSD